MRKIYSLLLVLILILTSLFLVPQVSAHAEEIHKFAVKCNERKNITHTVTDHNRSKYIKINEDDILHVTSPQPFAYIYLEWHGRPSPWQMTAERQDVKIENEYVHQLIRLSEPVAECSIRPDGDCALARMCLFSEGDLPDWVQDWQPPLEKADLLLVPTHADDDILYMGGVLAVYVGQRGYKAQVAYMTNHWHETPRPHELLDALWYLGVTNYPIIGPFMDSYAAKPGLWYAENFYGREAVLEWQVEQLRRFRPDVVIGHDLNGEYGHGAHCLNAVTLCEALELSNDPEGCPGSGEQYGLWDVPKMYLHDFPANRIILDLDEPIDRYGGETGYEAVISAYLLHKSQQYAPFWPVMDASYEDCRLFGLYRSTVGRDTGINDMFENIRPDREENRQPDPREDEERPAAVSDTVISGGDPFAPEHPVDDGKVIVWLGTALLICFIVIMILFISKVRRRR